jgi:hypothetical protein
VNLISGDRRSPEERQSYVSEGALLCRAAGPILTLHYAIVGRWTAKRDAISAIVGAHSGEGTASGHSTLEVENVRRFKVRPSGLIVAAILVQPRNWVGIGPAVCWHWGLWQWESGELGANCERGSGKRADLNKLSSTTNGARRSHCDPRLASVHWIQRSVMMVRLMNAFSRGIKCRRAGGPFYAFWFGDRNAKFLRRAAGRERVRPRECRPVRADELSRGCWRAGGFS